MKCYSLTHLTDHILLRDLSELVSQARTTTAALLAHLAEVDERKLYLPAAYPSMFAWCVGELHLSEDSAAKRIQAARAARRFPAIYPALADGRLHLSAVVLLAPHLTDDNAESVLSATARMSKSEIERLLAERFPRPDVPSRLEALAPAPLGLEAAPGPRTEAAGQHALGHVEPPASPGRVAPLSPERFALQLTIGQGTHDKLRYAQELLGHAVPSGSIAEVLDRALDALIARLEQRKLAATARSRPGSRRESADQRHIPAEVRRMVWRRDGGRCTFVSESGKRCEARKCLEFDHVEAVARGGQTNAGNLKLKCRAHNQHAAECAFGSEFMREKREHRKEAQRRAAQAKEHAKALEKARSEAAAEAARELDVKPWLRQLGYNVADARRGAEFCAHIPNAPIEDRLRVALRGLAPACVRRAVPMTSSPA